MSDQLPDCDLLPMSRLATMGKGEGRHISDGGQRMLKRAVKEAGRVACIFMSFLERPNILACFSNTTVIY